MKEITRIHIAKIPYDIEIAAKNEIEKYIKTLEAYANDSELLQDIEIRITELLVDRGVMANGIISTDDVASIRKQLGEPKDFMGDDGQTDDVIEIGESPKRKLYRNTDSAILGGVLSGMANYFMIDPLWLRLIFIVTLFFSAGAVMLVYLILWIIIPPARTAAEKLQMCGKPVTLDSIKELNESDHNLIIEHKKASSIRRTILLVVGAFLSFISVVILIFTIFVAFGISRFSISNYMIPGSEWTFISAFILAILAGLLLSILFAICAYVVFTLNINKRIIFSAIAIIIVGLSFFGTAIGLVSYQQMQNQTQDNFKSSAIELPSGFSEINKMTVNAGSINIKYVVDDNFHIELRSSLFIEKHTPKLSIKNDNLFVDYVASNSSIWPQLMPTLTIYGPRLDLISVKQGDVTYSTNKQDMELEISGQNSKLDLQSGTFNQLIINAQKGSEVTTSAATVENVVINSQTGSSVSLGTVKTISITQPESCPIDLDTRVDVKGISTGLIQYNGKIINAKTYNSNCGSIILNDNNY